MSEADYEKMKILGGGSFGQVYKARKKGGTGQTCAMKYISKQTSRKNIHDARSEIYIMERLKHPNIVQLLESFETENNIILICEYAVKELFRAMREEPNGRFCEEKVRKLSSQIASALFYLHSRTVLHRDLKPQNVLIVKDGTVKICDFGFSRIMGETYYAKTILGTLYYMAPELLTEYAQILYTEKVDLWALGCIIYELFVGLPAFASKSLKQIRLMHKNIPLPRDSSHDFRDLLTNLLSCNPHNRMPWPHILKHAWFKGEVTVSAEDLSRDSPYTKPEIAAQKCYDHYMKVRRVMRYRHGPVVRARDMVDGEEEKEEEEKKDDDDDDDDKKLQGDLALKEGDATGLDSSQTDSHLAGHDSDEEAETGSEDVIIIDVFEVNCEESLED